MLGGIEAGGTKFICGVGTGPEHLETVSFPTGSPDESVRQALAFFRDRAGSRLSALGIASFGPVDLDKQSPTYGRIMNTPKTAWRNYDFAGTVARALCVPVELDTDVNAAALAEARWGAAQDVDDCVYVTVGTGIGGGAIVRGRLLHGLMHPEIGHMRVPHDRTTDPFAGSCPFHGDCLEGLASGPAIFQRWGVQADELPSDHAAWRLEGEYLALGLANLVSVLSPQRIVLGGGLMQRDLLYPIIREGVARAINGYVTKAQLAGDVDRYIVPPRLGSYAGVLGALLLAEQA